MPGKLWDELRPTLRALWEHRWRIVFVVFPAFVAAVPGAALVLDRWAGTDIIEEVLPQRDLGECVAGLELEPDQYCTYPSRGRDDPLIRFRVFEEGARWGFSQQYRRGYVNELDVAVVGEGSTFQAREVADRNWKLMAAGVWQYPDDEEQVISLSNDCRKNQILKPGQFCIDANSGAHLRIYAVQHPDGPPETKDGYASLDFEPVESEGLNVATFEWEADSVVQGRRIHTSTLGYVDDDWRFLAVRDSTEDNAWRVTWAGTTESNASDADRSGSQTGRQDEGQQTSLDGDPSGSATTEVSPVTPEPLGGEEEARVVPQDDEIGYEAMKDYLVRILFQTNDPDGDTYHGFADYGIQRRGERLGECDGYDGGHASWHVQTKSVAGDATENREFFSLSEGVVIPAEQDEARGVIAVWDKENEITTLYANARRKYVDVGQDVKVGTLLGVQGGNPDLNGTANELVHIEVRPYETGFLACGADGDLDGFDEDFDPIDPVVKLYEIITQGRTE